MIRVKFSLNDKNMHIALPYITGPHQKKTRVALLQLSRSDRVLFWFCMMDCGHQKYHVERSVEYACRKSLARKDSFDAIPAAQDYPGNEWVKLNDLNLMVSRLALCELVAGELILQLPVPEDLGSFALKQACDNQSVIWASGKNFYPVPKKWMGQAVVSKVFSNQLSVLDGGELPGPHPCSFGARQWVITLDYYWHARDRKSGALPCSSTIEAAGDNLTFEQYRHGLLQQDYKARAEKCKKSLIPQARFLLSQGLRHLRWEGLPPEAQKALLLGVYLEYIHSSRYPVLAGNRGTKRTLPGLGLGTKAGYEGSLVLCIMVLRMLLRINEIRSEKFMSNREQCAENNDPTIGEEFGNITCDKQGPKLPYNHRSLMAVCKSSIRTTTPSFDRWYENFRDPVLPAAMIDKLIRLTFMINKNGQWSCKKETCK